MPTEPPRPIPEQPEYYVNRWKALFPIALVSIASTLTSSSLNVSLPVISEQFNAGIGIVEWVIMAFLLAVTSLLMISGRVGDLLGRRRTYQTGLIVFTITTTLCGLANSITTLIIFRILQGIGAALTVSVGPALIGEIFPPEQRGKALGLLGTTVSVGLAVGPAIGGIITDVLSWRYIFYMNIPFCILAFILIQTNLKPDKATRKPKFDLVGSFSMAVGLICLTLFLSRGSEQGWQSFQIIFLAAMAVIFLSVFIRMEKVHPEPILDLKLFNNRIFSSATVAGFLAFSSLFAQTFLLPFYLIQLRGFPAAHAGLFLMAVPSIMGIIAPLAGALSDKIGTRGLCSIGMIIQGVSYVLLTTIDTSTAQSYIVAALLLQGLGIGMFNPPNNADLLGSVPRNRLGNASGMMGLTRTMGMIAGVAISTSIFIGVRSTLLQNAGLAADAGFDVTGFAFLSGIHYAFWAGAGFAWAGAVIVWVRTKRNRAEG